MATLHDVMLYLCREYPHKSELSKARVAKMIYLADWRFAILHRRQLTNLTWTFNHYGPYLDDVVEEARQSGDFKVIDTTNLYGNRKELIEVTATAPKAQLAVEECEVLDHVIEETKPLYFNDFLKLVYSTFPIITQPRHSRLDLVSLAEEYERVQKTLPKP